MRSEDTPPERTPVGLSRPPPVSGDPSRQSAGFSRTVLPEAGAPPHHAGPLDTCERIGTARLERSGCARWERGASLPGAMASRVRLSRRCRRGILCGRGPSGGRADAIPGAVARLDDTVEALTFPIPGMAGSSRSRASAGWPRRGRAAPQLPARGSAPCRWRESLAPAEPGSSERRARSGSGSGGGPRAAVIATAVGCEFCARTTTTL